MSFEILFSFTSILFTSFNTEYFVYNKDSFGITSSFNKYVHLFVILLINSSAVASLSTISSKFHGRIASLLFVFTQAHLLFFDSGPT